MWKKLYKPFAPRVRAWSNRELRRISGLFHGDVANVSGWEDKDKEGDFYRNYFPNASSYTVTNFGLHKARTEPAGIDLDLTGDLPEHLAGGFDVVFNHTTLEHVFDVFTAFRNLARMSRDIVILVVPFIQQHHEAEDYGDFWRFTPSCVRKLFETNGLTPIYESFSNMKHRVNYLFFVGSRHPDRWEGKLPPHKRLRWIGKWVG